MHQLLLSSASDLFTRAAAVSYGETKSSYIGYICSSVWWLANDAEFKISVHHPNFETLFRISSCA